MKDGVPKQTGNSRYLKSAIAEDITFEQFRDLLRSGTLPVDLNGINADGWAELGTPLNKASLMSGTVESQYGLSATNVPSDVFVKIKSLIDAANSNISSLTSRKSEMVYGSYQGNDVATRTISLGFKPVAVIVMHLKGTGPYSGTALYNASSYGGLAVSSRNAQAIRITSSGFTVYEDENENKHTNLANSYYTYIAFKQ